MARNSDTRPNYITFYRDVFGFSDRVAAALHVDQLFKDAETIAEFGDSEINNVCRTLRRDSSLPIAKLAVTRLKLLTFWVRHQLRTGHVIGGVQYPLVRTELKTLNSLTAMVTYTSPLFFELRTSLITFRIFVRCQRLIARNVADGFLLFSLADTFIRSLSGR
jgi:hypothetical protein